MTLSEGQNSTQNFGFRARISTDQAEISKNRPCKAENNALLTSEQLQNNFPKAQKGSKQWSKQRYQFYKKCRFLGRFWT